VTASTTAALHARRRRDFDPFDTVRFVVVV